MNEITHTFIAKVIDTADEHGLAIHTATAYCIGASKGITLAHLDKAAALARSEKARRSLEAERG